VNSLTIIYEQQAVVDHPKKVVIVVYKIIANGYHRQKVEDFEVPHNMTAEKFVDMVRQNPLTFLKQRDRREIAKVWDPKLMTLAEFRSVGDDSEGTDQDPEPEIKPTWKQRRLFLPTSRPLQLADQLYSDLPRIETLIGGRLYRAETDGSIPYDVPMCRLIEIKVTQI